MRGGQNLRRGKAGAGGDFFKLQPVVFDSALLRQHPAGTDIGVAGEGHLPELGKNGDARGVFEIIRWQDEGGLAQIEFVGECLHLRIG